MNLTRPPVATRVRALVGSVGVVALVTVGCARSTRSSVPATTLSGTATTSPVDGGSKQSTSSAGSATTAAPPLPADACEVPAGELGLLSPQVPLDGTVLGNRSRTRLENRPIEFQEPFTVGTGSTGTMAICRYASGQGNSTNDARLTVTVVDFTGGVNEDPGPDLAQGAVAKLRDRYVQLGASDGYPAPTDVPGVGDGAFRAGSADGLTQALVARKGKLLLMILGSQGSATNGGPQLGFDRFPTVAGKLLDAVAPSAAPTPTTTAPASKSDAVETRGAIDGVWTVRNADVAGAATCTAPIGAEIPIATNDGSSVGFIRIGYLGKADDISLSSGRLPDILGGTGGFKLRFSGDARRPEATLDIDTTLTGNGGSPATTIKGRLTFTCP